MKKPKFFKSGRLISLLLPVLIFLLSGTLLAQEVYIDPSSSIDSCSNTDTLWIYIDNNISGMEAADFKISYDHNYLTPQTVVRGADITANDFFVYQIHAEDSININIGILAGSLDGQAVLAGIVYNSDSEINATGISFSRSILRDADNQNISHTTSGSSIQIDCTSPSITCPANVNVECYADIPAVDINSVTVSDNFDVNPVVTHVGDVSDGNSCPEVISRTYRATDAAGNYAECTQTITIDDVTDPVITCPASLTVDCGQSTDPSNTGTATATDNCDSSPDISYSDSQVDDVITRTWVAVDDCGNTDECVQTITVEDTTDPTITCPANVNVECYADIPAVDINSVTVSDDCDANPVVTHVGDVSDGNSCPEVISRTYRVTDAAGNYAECTQTITVNDVTDPVITCPASLLVDCGESTDPSSTGIATATDNCDTSPDISYSDSQVDNVITRTWVAADDCGNTDECVQTITIDDSGPPTMETIVEPENQYYNVAPVFSNFGFDDDCGLDDGFYQIDGYTSGNWTEIFSDWPGLSWAIPGFNALSEGQHTIYFMATDDIGYASGSSGELSWTFYKDTQAPAPPTNFTVLPGHEKCKLSWTNPIGDPGFAGVEVRRNPWDIGAYPEYDDDYPTPLGYPADEAEGDLVYQGTAESYRDSASVGSMPRNVYHYSIFSYDAAGNYSTASTVQQGRATNYWLGDVSGDGNVYFEDLLPLSNCYWTYHGDPNYNSEFDIGPTYLGNAHGVPETDNVINFEDLIIYAINFGEVGPNQKQVPLFTDTHVDGALGLTLQTSSMTPAVGEEFTVSISLENNSGDVKGINFELLFDGDALEYIGTEQSPALKISPVPVFFADRENEGKVEVSLALLGNGLSIGGSGELVQLHFRLKKPGQLSFGFENIDLRDTENQVLLSGSSGSEYVVGNRVPSRYALGQNYPNPFNPNTEISYELPEAGHVTLKIYNVRGQLVRTLVDEFEEAGYHKVMWNSNADSGKRVSSGIYLYRMESSDFVATRKMVLMK
jgi:hypothetical protein